MSTLRQRGWACAALALSAGLGLHGRCPLHAEEKSIQIASSSALGAAIEVTRTRGAATVAVVTSSEQRSSVQFWKELNDGAWARSNRGFVKLVNVSKDTDPALVRAMNVSHFPTVVVYGRSPQGVRILETIVDCDNAEAMVARLQSLDVGIDPPAKVDRAVNPTAFSGDQYASGQAQSPPPAYCPPVPQAPQAQPQPVTVSLTPSVAQPLQTTANVIQVPSQSLMIQQAPPQVFLAPTQAPIVYVPQTTNAAPTLSLSAAPAPAPPRETSSSRRQASACRPRSNPRWLWPLLHRRQQPQPRWRLHQAHRRRWLPRPTRCFRCRQRQIAPAFAFAGQASSLPRLLDSESE